MIWRLKIFLKILISNISFFNRFVKLFGLIKVGNMASFEYSLKIFNLHFKRFQKFASKEEVVMLEIGPGLSITSALLGYSAGFKKIYLVDVKDFAKKDVNFYKQFALEMKKKGYKIPDISKATSREDILKKCNAEYLVDGLKSLIKIKSNSVDFVFSHSVLEHIRKKQFLNTILELKRIIKKNGISSHCIDYQDHLDKSLNNLRFSERVWESYLFASSSFYTNRIPALKLHKYFQENGFEILEEKFGKWPKLPLDMKYLDRDFRIFKEDDLINRTSSLIVKRK